MRRATRIPSCVLAASLAGWILTRAAGAAVSAESVVPVTLTYSAPSECPSKDFIVERVAQMVQTAPASPVIAKATITREATYQLILDLEGGTRHVTSDSCDSLAETLTVIVALAIDPHARVPSTAADGTSSSVSSPDSSAVAPQSSAAAPPSSAAAPPSSATPVAVPSTSLPTASPSVAASAARPPSPPSAVSAPNRPNQESEPEPREAKHTSERLRLTPVLSFWTEFGMLPSLSYGPRLGLWLDSGPWSVALAAEWLAPQWAQMSNASRDRGGSISFLGGQIYGCWAPTQRARLLLCLGLESGDVMGKGKGEPTSDQLGHGFWLAGTGGVAYRPVIWSRLGGELRAEFAMSALRPEFGFSGNDWRFEPHPWSLRVAVGFSWSL